MRYAVLISYDGTFYHGWQHQTHCLTVSDALSTAFYDVFKVDASLQGASRTDAGVHAFGQIAHLETSLDLDPRAILFAWNNRLPVDIVVRKLAHVSDDFHALKNVTEKVYYYHFFIQRPLPFAARYGMFCHRQVDIDKLRECLNVFVGTHDFRSFCTGDEAETTIRTINSIEIIYIPHYHVYRIIVKGKSFLRYMIRRIVGAALDCAMRQARSVDDIMRALEEKNPEQQLPTAVPQGLFLRRITYMPSPWSDYESNA